MHEAALEKIKARIRQLRALADDRGATEGEVMNALAIAERLKREHGLDDVAIGKIGRMRIGVPLGRRRLQPVDSLVSAIGFYAECECWLQHGAGPATAFYYGSDPDALIAEYLHALCYGAVRRAVAEFRLSPEYRRRRKPRTRNAAEKAFTVGMVKRLADRVLDLKFAEWDRIVAKQRELSRDLQKQGMRFTQRKVKPEKTAPGYDNAAYAGMRAAGDLPINPGIGQAPDRPERFLPAPGVR